MFPQNVFFCLSYQVALGHGRGGDSRLAAPVDYPGTIKNMFFLKKYIYYYVGNRITSGTSST